MENKIVTIDDLPAGPGYDRFRHNPCDICILVENGHCGVWLPQTDDETAPYGVIGHYSAGSSSVSRRLLDSACKILRDKGCQMVYGPMDGNTWKPYRLVTWSDGSPPFLMEPQNPPEWPGFWMESGFVSSHEYISTVVSSLSNTDPRLTKAKKRLRDLGISWRPVDMAKFTEELEQVYSLSLEAFRNNVLYTEIDKKTFLQQYLPFADKIDSRYVLLAFDKQGRCCGFVFAIPDLTQLQQGNIDRLIIKTLAVRNSRRSGGLGAVLVDEVQQEGFRNGLSTAIHALMYQGNVSTNIGKNSRVIRRYSLYGKKLT